MNFTQFKDRIWKGLDWCVRMLFKLPRPVTRAGYRGMVSLLWVVWPVPRNPARRTFRALATLSGKGPPVRLFRLFLRGFALTLYRFELLRQGELTHFSGLLEIPEAERFEAMLAKGGVMMMMPHAGGSISMAEALAQRYRLTLVVRSAKDEGRARHQLEHYAKMSCDVVDVRRAESVAVTRAVIGALRKGRIVLAAGDLINAAPEGAFDEAKDLFRVTAFDQPVGALGWPARFAKKAKVPILPVMIVQTEERLTLQLGPEIAVTDLRQATQAWLDGMVEMACQEPADWLFALDKRWMAVLETAAERPPQG